MLRRTLMKSLFGLPGLRAWSGPRTRTVVLRLSTADGTLLPAWTAEDEAARPPGRDEAGPAWRHYRPAEGHLAHLRLGDLPGPGPIEGLIPCLPGAALGLPLGLNVSRGRCVPLLPRIDTYANTLILHRQTTEPWGCAPDDVVILIPHAVPA